MQPVQEILNRIRWDPGFAGQSFEVGYYDRVASRVVVVPFTDLVFPPDDHYAFTVVDGAGVAHSIPYHRVRDIYRAGRRIWHRDAPGPDRPVG
jgi:uncharacterized protein (UPF0248 family)